MLPTNTQGPVVHQAFATWTMSTRLPFGRCARTEASEEIQVAAYSTVPFLCAAPKRVRSAEQPRWFGGAQPVGTAGQTPCSVVAFQSLKSQQFQELPGEHVRADIPRVAQLYSEECVAGDPVGQCACHVNMAHDAFLISYRRSWSRLVVSGSTF